MAKKNDTRKPATAKKPAKPQVDAAVKGEPKPDLGAVREQIDGIDRRIQELIAERAQWAHQVGKAKGKLAAAVDYYRPEREAQVLRKVVDRNDGLFFETSLPAKACSTTTADPQGPAQ